MARVKKAVISVYDKKGITTLAKGLGELDVEILSTGGTAKEDQGRRGESDGNIRLHGVSRNTGRKGEDASPQNPRGSSRNKGR